MLLLLLVVSVDSIVFLVFFFTVTSPSLTRLPVRLAVPSTGKKTRERIANNSKDLGCRQGSTDGSGPEENH